MCFTAEASMMALIIILVIVVMLWWRNEKYDRVIAALLLAVSLIQLVEYLRHKGSIDSTQGGRYIFLVLWLQILVLTIAVYLYLRSTLAFVLMLIAIGVFIWALSYQATYATDVGPTGHLEWKENGGPILGNMNWVYGLGLLLPLLVVQAALGWTDVGLWLILAVLVLTYAWTSYAYPGAPFPSLWCYAAVAVAFTAWLVGAF